MTKLGFVVKSWRRRWFRLSGNTLAYFKKQEDQIPAGIIDLRSCRAVRVSTIGRANTLEVAVPGRTYYLSCVEDTEMNDWLGAISRAVVRSSRAMDWDHE
eukprot:c10311_g1_i1.p1 GENE.c10311_g1_i1~~c10311_g1_i1.p1  ORF type:complete len:100 (+),score=7.31 c10311_g1_i1:119-418(+)